MAERTLADVAGNRLHIGDLVQYIGDPSAHTFRVSLLDPELSLVYLDDDIAAIPATLLRVAVGAEDIDSAPPFPLPDLGNVLRFYPRPYRTPNRLKAQRRAGGVA